jgi:hypothetical protein
VTLPLVVVLALVLRHAAEQNKSPSATDGSAQPRALPPISVAAPPPDQAADGPCTKLLGTLPIVLAGLAGRPARSSWAYVAAWGDPAVILRCGVPRPPSLTAGSSDLVLVANGVNFLQASQHKTHVFTAIDRAVYIELQVPDSYAQPPLGPIADAITKALPAVCVVDPAEAAPTKLCTHRS